MHRPTRTWSPKLGADSVPIAYDASLRHYRGGHAGFVAKALEQPLLLPKDMEAYRDFNHPELFLSLKRDLAMVGYLTYCFTLILHFLIFYSTSKTSFLFFFLDHTANFCSRGVGKECTWRDQDCLGCSSRSGSGARRPKGKPR